MRLRLLGIGLLALGLLLLWPPRPKQAEGGWGGGGQFYSGRGGLPGTSLVRGFWSRVAPNLKPNRGALAEDSSRLRPLGSLRDAPAAMSPSQDPAAYWQAVFSHPMRSARADPSLPHAPPTVSVQAGSQPSKRPPARLPTVRTPPVLAANRPDAPQSPRQETRRTGETGGSGRGGGRGDGGAAAPQRRQAADFDGRRAGGGAGRLTRPSATAVPAWQPADRKKGSEPKPAKPPKPPTLSDWLGRGALKAPRQRLQAPTFTPLKDLFPERLPDGHAYQRASPSPALAEAVVPPDERAAYEDWLYADERRKRGAQPHWHQDGQEWLFHAGKAWGAAQDGRWSWLLEHERRWWTVADGAQRLVRHEGAWWWRTKDGWFLLKGGEPWAWRRFPEWEGHGFISPTRGTQVVYSADGARLAVLTPGAETVVFDCVSGEVLARFPAAPRPGDAAPLAPYVDD